MYNFLWSLRAYDEDVQRSRGVPSLAGGLVLSLENLSEESDLVQYASCITFVCNSCRCVPLQFPAPQLELSLTSVAHYQLVNVIGVEVCQI